MTLFLASLAAIALLVALCWVLGFRGTPVLADAAAAERIADAALTGFRAAEVALAAGGHGALLKGRDGRLVAVRPVGDRWLVREVGGVRAEAGRIMLPREPGAAAFSLDLGGVPAWL